MDEGDKVLYVHDLGGRPHISVETIEVITNHEGFEIVFLKGHVGYVDSVDLFTKETILSLFEND